MLNSALEKESRGCTMYIFVSNDTDSLCALRIFTVSSAILSAFKLRFDLGFVPLKIESVLIKVCVAQTILRQDEVRFVTIPVFSNSYLCQKIAEVRSMSEVSLLATIQSVLVKR